MESAGPPTGPAGSDDRDDGAPRRLQPTAPPTEMPASAPSPGGDLAEITVRGGDDATMVSAITMDSDMDPLLGSESARRHPGGSGGHMGTVDEGDPHSAVRTEVPRSGVREPGPDDPWLDRLEARILAQSDSEAGGRGMSGGIGVSGVHQGTRPTSPGAAPSAPTDRLQQRIEQRRREKMKAAGARSLSSSRHSSSAGGGTGADGRFGSGGGPASRLEGLREKMQRKAPPGAGGPHPPGAAPADDLDLLTERIGRKSPGGDVFDLLAKRVLDQLTDRKDGPAGGVSRGQTFRAPFELGGGGDGGGGGGGVPASVVPQGRWKDGLCDCCTFGCFHPALWMAICCPLALLGQVQNRLRLNSLGVRANPGDRSPFKVLLGISIIAIFWSILFPSLLMWAFIDPIIGIGWLLPSDLSAIELVYLAFIIVVALFWICVASITRRYIRARSAIPETSCQGCEDFCCPTWCGCCAVAQMARHTADYETYTAKCCSETGLPVNAPQPQFGGTEIV